MVVSLLYRKAALNLQYGINKQNFPVMLRQSSETIPIFFHIYNMLREEKFEKDNPKPYV